MRIEPYAAVQPGSRLETGSHLKALRKSRSKLIAEKKDPLALMKALGQQAAAAKARAAGNAMLATKDLNACVILPYQVVVYIQTLGKLEGGKPKGLGAQGSLDIAAAAGSCMCIWSMPVC